jgi:cytochrome c oxidase subunit II
MIDPFGPQAASIDSLWRFMLITATIVYVIVIAALFVALRTSGRDPGEKRATQVVTGAAVATATILLLTLGYSLRVGQALPPSDGATPTIQLIGHQWWWEARYQDPNPHNWFTTANEIHIPVGVPVRIKLQSRDVIHSFWIPALNGKRDMIPGNATVTWIRVDSAGIYRGQCAEFCGHQHAKMVLRVIAQPRVEFDKWVDQMRTPAAPPSDSLREKGRQVFMGAPCVTCHNIVGTPASATVAPDLTHFGSSLTIGAGAVPNTPEKLAAWIRDPHTIKPGVKMPAINLSPDDLRALVAYLEGLK